MKDKCMQLIEQQLKIHNNNLERLDAIFNNYHCTEKTIDTYNGYIRDRVKLKGSIEALVQFRLKWCEENV